MPPQYCLGGRAVCFTSTTWRQVLQTVRCGDIFRKAVLVVSKPTSAIKAPLESVCRASGPWMKGRPLSGAELCVEQFGCFNDSQSCLLLVYVDLDFANYYRQKVILFQGLFSVPMLAQGGNAGDDAFGAAFHQLPAVVCAANSKQGIRWKSEVVCRQVRN